MRMQEHKIENKTVLHIYVSEQERDNIEIQGKLNQIKSENDNVVIFISGDKEPKQTLEEMVKIMKKLQ